MAPRLIQVMGNHFVDLIVDLNLRDLAEIGLFFRGVTKNGLDF